MLLCWSSSQSDLAKAIAGWNDRFFNMWQPDTRKHSELFHVRGSQERHLAMEVSLFTPPEGVRDRLRQRILDNADSFFGDAGAGKAGTTGASFIAGNVGLGNRNQGQNLMEVLFPLDGEYQVNASQNLVDGDYTGMAKDDRRTSLGEATTNSNDGGASSADLRAFEQSMKETIEARSDVQYMFGGIDDMDFQFQHRLWRFGPVFDSKSKGGIWHKDTCPFGINGALPEGSIMFTLVYILYTENLDFPTAGTRVKDEKGNIFQLPCEAGRGNMIRSGEDDANTFFHSGPLNIKSADPSKPAYRIMMQSKTVVTPKGGRKKTKPQRGHWRGLGIKRLSLDEGDEAKGVRLAKWLTSASEEITYGIGESNALGSAAYPLGVVRGWSVARDLCDYLGFQTQGFLPTPDKVRTPVVMFGWGDHSFDMVKLMDSTDFRVSTIASSEMYETFFKKNQDAYSNMNTMSIDRKDFVRGLFENEPFDMHLIVDVAPAAVEGSIYTDFILANFGDLLKEIASRPRGEGTIATVTYLSEVNPGEDALQAEREWTQFGDDFSVRVVIMRVADRIYGPHNSALLQSTNADLYAKLNPCWRRVCTREQPLTRIFVEDLAHIVIRMLSMFDIVETHGQDPSMGGSAHLSASLSRFPSGLILNLIDDGPPDNMLEAELWGAIIQGKIQLRDLKQHMDESPPAFSTPPSWYDPDANALMKQKLAYDLIYPSYRIGASKILGSESSVS